MMDRTQASSFDSRLSSDQLQRSRTYVQGVSLILQQNSTPLCANQPIKSDALAMLTEQTQQALEAAKINVANYIANPTAFSDFQVLCIALSTIISQQQKENQKYKEDALIAKDQVEQEQKKYQQLQENYDALANEVQKVQTSGSAASKQISDLKQQLTDCQERLKLQQTQFTTERQDNAAALASTKKLLQETEQELTNLQTEALRTKRAQQNLANTIAEAFGVEDSEATTPEEVIAAARKELGVAEGDTIVRSVKSRAKTADGKYAELLGKFGLAADAPDAASAIRNMVEQQRTRQLLSRLRQEYSFDRNCDDIIRAVSLIAADREGVIPALVDAFGLPETTTAQNVVAELTSRVGAAEETSILNASLQEENESLRRENEATKRLVQALQSESLAFERPEICTQTETAKSEEKETIERIGADVIDVEATLAEYDAMVKENQGRIEQLIQEKDREIAAARKDARAHYRAKVERLSAMVEQLAPAEEKAQQLRREKRSLAKAEQQLRRRNQELEASFAELSQARDVAEAQLAEASQQLTAVAAENERLSRELTVSQLNMETERTIAQVDPAPAIAELGAQIEAQAEEVRALASQRNALMAVAHRQQAALAEAERAIQRISEEKPVIAEAKPVEQPVTQDDLLEALVDLDAKRIEDDLQDVFEIVSGPKPLKEKVVRALRLVIERLQEAEEKRAEAEAAAAAVEDKSPIVAKLLQMLGAQLRYVERIATTDDRAISEEMRAAMQEGAARVHQFLAENAVGFVEDNTLFDTLGLAADPAMLEDGVVRLFEEIEVTDAIAPVVIVLRQAIACALVLRRYCKEAQTQCSHYAAEAQLLRSEMQGFRREMETRCKAAEDDAEARVFDVQIKLQDAEEKLKSVENVLRANVQNPEMAAIVGRCLDQIAAGDAYDLSENEVMQSMQAELAEVRRAKETAIQELEATKVELSLLKENATKEIREISDTSDIIENDATSIIQGHVEEEARLREEIAKYRTEFDGVRAEFEKLQTNCGELRAALSAAEERAKGAEAETERVRQKTAAKLDKTVKAIAAEQNKRIERLQQRLKRVQREVKEKDAAIEEKESQLRTHEESAIELEQSRTAFEDELRNASLQFEASEARMRRENAELASKLAQAEVDAKVLQSRVKAAEEKAERARQQVESQLQLARFTADTAAQSRLEAAQEEFAERQRQLLADICGIFPEQVDTSVPISAPNVLHMLEEVNTRAKLLQRESEKSADFERQVREIRVVTQAPKGTRTTAVVADLIDDLKAARARADALEKAQKAVKPEETGEWSDWGRRVYSSVTQGEEAPRTSAELRLKLEERLFAGAGRTSLTEKLTQLRLQKALLERGDLPLDAPPADSLLPVVAALMFCRRVMRLSHHLPSETSFPHLAPPRVQDAEEVPMAPPAAMAREQPSSISALFGASIRN